MVNLNVRPLKHIISCKICGSDSNLWGVTDFNTRGMGSNHPNRYIYPLTGTAIYYHQCSSCDLIFTEAMDDWSHEEFGKYIYNEGYGDFDPNFESSRPLRIHDFIMQYLGKYHGCKMLDYGGGTGTLASLLRGSGLDCQAWDPFNDNQSYPERNSFSFMSCIEVLEHVPDPHSTIKKISEFLTVGGVLFFSTHTANGPHPEQSFSARGMNSFYVSPRTGHITIYSEKALEVLFVAHGFQVSHIDHRYHIAMKMQ